MSLTYKRTILGDSVALTEIYDKKFKTNYIKVSFTMPFDEKTSAANSMLQAMLVTSNAVIPSRTALTKTLSGLYGSSIASNSTGYGDYQSVGLSCRFIGDEYTIGGEKISNRVVGILINSLFNPHLENGKFSQKYFDIRKQELIDSITANINNKRRYSLLQAKKLIFKGEPASVSALGEIETAKAITQENLLSQYEYLRKSAAIEITVCGAGNIDDAVKMLTDKISSLERDNVLKIDYRKDSPVKQELCVVENEMDVNQSKLVMAYKSDYEDIYVVKMYCAILGWMQSSLLFENVREKQSLCYYCSVNYDDLKGTIIIDSGVEDKNIEKTKAAVAQQLEAMKNGDFSDEDLNNAKMFMKSQFMSNYDSVHGMAGWYAAQVTRNSSLSPVDVAEVFMNVTKEQIMNCAKSFKPDTVYVTKTVSEVENDG